MFADLLRRLTAPAPARLTDTDARKALGALLVRIAKSDGVYDAAEIARIDRVLATRYGLTDAQAAALRSDCEVLEAEAPDTVRFTRAIKAAVDFDDRSAVVEAMWDIVLADGVREVEEDALMRMVAPMLGLTDQQSAQLRQKIEAGRA